MFGGRNGAQLQRRGAPLGADPDTLDSRLWGGVATGEIDPYWIFEYMYTQVYVLKYTLIGIVYSDGIHVIFSEPLVATQIHTGK